MYVCFINGLICIVGLVTGFPLDVTAYGWAHGGLVDGLALDELVDRVSDGISCDGLSITRACAI